MSNANRDYAIVYDIKNSLLVLSRPLNFYLTDKNTSNIFVRLVTRIIIGDGIDQYADIENATNYVLTMRVIKPNNEIKSIQGTQHEAESLFQFDLTEDFKDIPGKYICELTISNIVNGRQEFTTSDPFNYEVKRSILSKVNVIEGGGTTIEKLLNDLDATKAELISKVDVERKRIDNLARLSEGSTTGDAELIDARIGVDGVSYHNLGTAIRTQISNINSDINTVLDKPIYLIRNASYEKEGGDVVWDNITIDLVAKANTMYSISYGGTDCNLADNDIVVSYTFLDSSDNPIIVNTDLFTKNEINVNKQITTTANTVKLRLFLSLSRENALTRKIVKFYGLNVYEGVNNAVKIKPEVINDVVGDRIDHIEEDVNIINDAIDEILEKPLIIVKKNYAKQRENISWQNIEVICNNAIPNTKYIVKYDEIINNRLSYGNYCVWYKCCGNSGDLTTNTGLLSVGGSKIGSFITPENTTSIVFYLSMSLNDPVDSNETVEFKNFTLIQGDVTSFTIKPEAIENVVPNMIDMFELNLPKDIYVSTNCPLEIYNKHVCYCGNINNYHFKWTLPSGKNMGRKLVIQGNQSLNGKTENLNLKVYDNNLKLVAEGNSTVHYKTPSTSLAPSDYKKILCIGDSLTELPYWRENLKQRLKDEIGDKFYYIGNLGTQEYKHEGHSGWTIDNFISDTSEGWNGNYKVKVVSDPGTITPKKQYKFGEKIFEFEKKEAENGEIWLYFNRISGGGFVEANSTAIEVNSGVEGMGTINYTMVAITSYNPFFNPSTQNFDANYYSGNLGVVPDYCFIWLGANGVSESLDVNANLDSATINITKLKTIVGDILTKWTNTKIFVCYNHYYSNQSGLGYVSGTYSFDKGIELGVFNNNRKIKELLESYNDRVILVPIGQTHDSEYNYQFDMVGVNNRNNIAKEMMCYDKVHPFKDTGFLQFADTIYATLINNL